MTYGENKRRDMIRSVLPSTNRGGAADELRAARVNQRRKANRALSQITGTAEDAIETYLDMPEAIDRWPNRRTRYAVRDRRAADKVRPLMRWGKAITAHMPLEDRLPYLKAMLPDNTIGRHAVQHLEDVDGIYNPQEHDWWYWRNLSLPTGPRRYVRGPSFDEMRWRLYEEIAKPKGHAKFNRWAKKNLVRYTTHKDRYGRYEFRWGDTPSEVHYLKGAHHIEDFVRRLYEKDAFTNDWRVSDSHRQWCWRVADYLGLS